MASFSMARDRGEVYNSGMALLFQTIAISVAPEVLEAMRNEMASGGMTGTVFIGSVAADLDLAYMLWHDAGEVPLAWTVSKRALEKIETARGDALVFLVRWNNRQQ